MMDLDERIHHFLRQEVNEYVRWHKGQRRLRLKELTFQRDQLTADLKRNELDGDIITNDVIQLNILVVEFHF